MAGRRARMPRQLFSALACAGLLGLSVEGAYADPVYPSQHQVDQAQRAVQQDKSAIAPIQARFDAAQRQLSLLVRQSQIAAEQYDAATLRLQRAQLDAQIATDRLGKAQRRYADARSDVGRLAAAAYRDGGGLGSVSLVVNANGPEQLATGAHMIAHQDANLKATLQAADQAREDAQAAQVAAQAAVHNQAMAQVQVAAAAQAARVAVATEQVQLAAVSARRDALLAQLAAAERVSVQLERRRQQGMAEEAARRAAQAKAVQRAQHALPAYDGSAAGRALAYAYAQLGKPYVWGATGPDTFDCSGLTMRAWEAAGLTLPHFAAFQYQAGHPIGYGELRPGDLLFWATDASDSNTIYHEAMYIGGQRMIQAPRSGENVEISSMWMWGPIQFFARPD
ncbi:C40 family peptidase [Actinocrinis puniceicyclus]|uniref:C40 family peptidase n=1 Tax=Actinocrinis puniceicyclus TaxID=977794 RepID=A0A8J7WNQ1_9ACTN|nr:C40 family peptidase [Actinocrinis puniceicyclus]MBS2962790.1 C40 family peptidase [Actinocrinis puniceicyclus]